VSSGYVRQAGMLDVYICIHKRVQWCSAVQCPGAVLGVLNVLGVPCRACDMAICLDERQQWRFVWWRCDKGRPWHGIRDPWPLGSRVRATRIHIGDRAHGAVEARRVQSCHVTSRHVCFGLVWCGLAGYDGRAVISYQVEARPDERGGLCVCAAGAVACLGRHVPG
jgi:hypothetical protein